jgi:hypothetical protein
MASAPKRAVGTAGAGPAGMVVDLVAFACELAMLVLLVIAGWSLGDGGLLGIALAVLYPALAIVVWAVWIAPNAARRLPDPWRFAVQFALFAATAAATAAAGRSALGVVFGAVAVGAFALGRRTGGAVGEARS